jgi:branched-chain amino acid transport system permease protein
MVPATGRFWILAALLLIGLLVPLTGDTFYIKFATRVMIYGMAAVAIDILLGYAGLISLGHAAFFGIGAYAAGMLTNAGVVSAFLTWPLAVFAALLAALVIGALSLRTTGLYFIMITLAFAQMVYYVAQSLRAYGGNDGFSLVSRNTFAGLIDISNPVAFYYLVLVLLVAVVVFAMRAMNAGFGVVLRASRDNSDRLEAVGVPPYPYRLAAFAISGAIAGLAGALLANLNQYVAPQGMLSWQVSAELLVMVIFGAAGTIIGPIIGAAIYLLCAEILSEITQHWMLLFGPLLIARVMLIKDGVYALLLRAVAR